MLNNDVRLDAVETAWLLRENETINKALFSKIYPENKARSLVPTEVAAIGAGKVYTWGMISQYGEAKEIFNGADDLPRAGTAVNDQSRIIKQYGASHGWDVIEIQEAARTGRNLSQMEADSAALAIATKVDAVLASGDGVILGLLNQTSTTTTTLTTKAGGGKTWALATPKQIVADASLMIGNVVNAMKASGGTPFSTFQLVIPVSQDILISTTPMGDGINMTIKQYMMANLPLSGIDNWHRCTAAGTNSVDRAVLYPKNPLVLGAVIAQEMTIMPPQPKNLAWVVPSFARCGGVVCRYPVAITYGDGL